MENQMASWKNKFSSVMVCEHLLDRAEEAIKSLRTIPEVSHKPLTPKQLDFFKGFEAFFILWRNAFKADDSKVWVKTVKTAHEMENIMHKRFKESIFVDHVKNMEDDSFMFFVGILTFALEYLSEFKLYITKYLKTNQIEQLL